MNDGAAQDANMPEDGVDDEPFGFLPDAPDASAVAEPVAVDQPRGHIPHRYRRSGGAAMLAAGMIGLRDVLEGKKDDRPVVEQHTNDDDVERPVEVFLDPDDPSASLVVIRDPSDNN